MSLRETVLRNRVSELRQRVAELERERDAAREDVRRVTYERDSLRMERDGLEQVRLRDNQYLLNQRDAAIARAEQAERERDDYHGLSERLTARLHEAERERDEARASWHAASEINHHGAKALEVERAARERAEELAEQRLLGATLAQERAERAEADSAAFRDDSRRGLLLWHGSHCEMSGGAYPENPRECVDRQCRTWAARLAADHPGAAMLERVRALERLYDACAAYFVHAAANHDDGCPEDDTCECPHIVRVNEAFNTVDALKERKP